MSAYAAFLTAALKRDPLISDLLPLPSINNEDSAYGGEGHGVGEGDGDGDGAAFFQAFKDGRLLTAVVNLTLVAVADDTTAATAAAAAATIRSANAAAAAAAAAASASAWSWRASFRANSSDNGGGGSGGGNVDGGRAGDGTGARSDRFSALQHDRGGSGSGGSAVPLPLLAATAATADATLGVFSELLQRCRKASGPVLSRVRKAARAANAADVAAGRPEAVTALLRPLITTYVLSVVSVRHRPELFRLLCDGEDMEEFCKLSAEAVLLRWLNFHVGHGGGGGGSGETKTIVAKPAFAGNGGSGRRTVTAVTGEGLIVSDLGPGLQDWRAYSALLRRLDFDGSAGVAAVLSSFGSRDGSWSNGGSGGRGGIAGTSGRRVLAERVVAAAQALGVAAPLARPAEVAAGDAAANVLLLAQLFAVRTGLPPLTALEARLLATAAEKSGDDLVAASLRGHGALGGGSSFIPGGGGGAGGSDDDGAGASSSDAGGGKVGITGSGRLNRSMSARGASFSSGCGGAGARTKDRAAWASLSGHGGGSAVATAVAGPVIGVLTPMTTVSSSRNGGGGGVSGSRRLPVASEENVVPPCFLCHVFDAAASAAAAATASWPGRNSENDPTEDGVNSFSSRQPPRPQQQQSWQQQPSSPQQASGISGARASSFPSRLGASLMTRAAAGTDVTASSDFNGGRKEPPPSPAPEVALPCNGGGGSGGGGDGGGDGCGDESPWQQQEQQQQRQQRRRNQERESTEVCTVS
ncbi:unnamed protein product [Phaeothamnion confervicola]